MHRFKHERGRPEAAVSRGVYLTKYQMIAVHLQPRVQG